MNRHTKESHVLAAVVRTPCKVIPIYSLEDFPKALSNHSGSRLHIPISS